MQVKTYPDGALQVLRPILLALLKVYGLLHWQQHNYCTIRLRTTKFYIIITLRVHTPVLEIIIFYVSLSDIEKNLILSIHMFYVKYNYNVFQTKLAGLILNRW